MMYDPFTVDRMRFDQEARERRLAAPRTRRLRARAAGRLALSALQGRRGSEV
ncbi:MAG: hypothetical protein ACJ735_05440 [Actinomycetes bacterium]